MDLVWRQRGAVHHRPLSRLGSLPCEESALHQPALLCLAKLADHDVDARLAFVSVVVLSCHARSVARTPSAQLYRNAHSISDMLNALS